MLKQGDPSMYAHVYQHSSQRRSGSANATRQHVNGLFGTPLRPLQGLTSPHVCRIYRDSLLVNIFRRPHVLSQLPPSSLRLLCFVDLTNMDLSSEDLRGLCDRFRVLIIGRGNTGKATILEEGAKPQIRHKGRLAVRASLIYLTLIVKLMVIRRPNTCQGRVGGPSSR